MVCNRLMGAALSAGVLMFSGCAEDPEPASLGSVHEQENPATAGTENSGAGDETIAADVPAAVAPAAAPAGLAAPDDVAAPPADAERTESGLATKILRPGTGTAHPAVRDRVSVHYTGWRAENGEMFDSSVQRGAPATFAVNGVIRGWTEGLQLMVAGERRRMWIPADLAYGNRPGRPAGMLVFDVELLSIEAAPVAPETPDNVHAAPANAETSASGLASIVLQAGEGDRHPAATDRVEVHYTGWRAEDGAMFDSSVTRGRPATFPLNRVIPGWTEGVQLMVVGEKRRFWIPGNLAYEGRSGPQGTLVFDVELLNIL